MIDVPAPFIFSAEKPRVRQRAGETDAETLRRLRRKWDEYHDARVMAECDHQAIVQKGRMRRICFRAFYGVEARWWPEA